MKSASELIRCDSRCGNMEEDVFNALQSRVAYLPGGVDREGRIIIVVNLAVNDFHDVWNKKYLQTSIIYIKKALGQELLQKGITVIVDAQKCSARLTRSHAHTMFSLFGDTPVKMYLVRSEGFWEKHVESCTKSHTKGEPIVLSKVRLLKYFDVNNLPGELGGTLLDNYDTWIQQRKVSNSNSLKHALTQFHDHRKQLLDEFRKEFEETMRDMETFNILLCDNKTVKPLAADKEMKRFAQMNAQIQRRVEHTIEMGKRVLNCINHAYEASTNSSTAITATNVSTSDQAFGTLSSLSASSGLISSGSGGGSEPITTTILPADLNVERSRVESMLNEIERKQLGIRCAWDDLENCICEARELTTLGEGVAFVTNWILGTAELMLNCKQTIGCDIQVCEELRREHNTLEMECRETYGFYAELLYKIDSHTKSKHCSKDSIAYKDLISQKDFMNFVCRSFAARLERRRNVLITSLRFHRLITEYFDRTSLIFESLVMGNRIEDFEAAASTLQKLKDSQMSLEILEHELIKEGEKLSDMLAMPVKDALGRDLGIDYSDDIGNIQEILDTTITRRNMFSDSVELQKLTLEQVTHIHAYEQDTQMAIKWMDDLYNSMIKCHSHVGCNIHEIHVQKDELQTFQETGESIYNYGCQLLEASRALRLSCKLNTEPAQKMSNQLQSIWHSLQSISQEQMTRLRVSAVFHRSVEDYCNKLRDLKMLVIANVHNSTAVLATSETQLLTSEITSATTTATATTDKVSEEPESHRNCLRKCLTLRERLLVEVGRMVRLGRLLKTRLKEPFISDVAVSTSLLLDGLNSAITISEEDNSDDQAAQTTKKIIIYPSGKNEIACLGISNKLAEIAEVAESLDEAIKDTQHNLNFLEANSNLLDKKFEQPRSNSSEDCHSRSTENDSFATASEGNFTPHSNSSSYQTADSSFINSWKNSFDSSADIEDTPRVLLMESSNGLTLSVNNISLESSDHSCISPSNMIETKQCDRDGRILSELVEDSDQGEAAGVETENVLNFHDSDKSYTTWRRNITKQTIKGFL